MQCVAVRSDSRVKQAQRYLKVSRATGQTVVDSLRKAERVDARLLEAGAGTPAAKLLRLHPPRVRDEQGPVVLDQALAELERRRRICAQSAGLHQLVVQADAVRRQEAHRRTWRKRRRRLSPGPVGRRRSATCGHRPRRARGCRAWRRPFD